MGLLCNFGGIVIADVWRQRCDQHQQLLQMRRNAGMVRDNAVDIVLGEQIARIREKTDRLQEVVRHNRFERVQLEIAGGATDTHGRVVANHLHGHHHHGFRLGRIDLARHDRAARFIGRQYQLPETAA